MSQKEKMHSCELYFPNDEEIMKEQTLCLEKLYRFQCHPSSRRGKKNRALERDVC